MNGFSEDLLDIFLNDEKSKLKRNLKSFKSISKVVSIKNELGEKFLQKDIADKMIKYDIDINYFKKFDNNFDFNKLKAEFSEDVVFLILKNVEAVLI